MKGLVPNAQQDPFSTKVAWDAQSGHSILIKAFDGSLTPHELNVLTADPEWSTSAIVLWEITKLHQLRRIEYGQQVSRTIFRS